jgi:hypothetical protein
MQGSHFAENLCEQIACKEYQSCTWKKKVSCGGDNKGKEGDVCEREGSCCGATVPSKKKSYPGLRLQSSAGESGACAGK